MMKKAIISKEEVAIIQLKDSVNLYFKERFISAITLAAAAEEILARLSDDFYTMKLGRKAKWNYADDNALFIAHFVSPIGRDLSKFTEREKEEFSTQEEKKYIVSKNKIRNRIKHNDLGEEFLEFSNFKDIARDHIAGAIINYKLFKFELPNDELILDFCKKEGVG